MSWLQESFDKRLFVNSMDVSDKTAVIQENANYSISNNLVKLTIGSGSTASITTNSEYYVNAGTDIDNIASLYSKHVIPFTPGQSMGVIFDARFVNPQIGSNQIVGLSNSTDTIGFGYINGAFGVDYRYFGLQQIMDLYVTARSTASSAATVILSGTTLTFTLGIGATISDTARDIATGINANTTLWKAQAIGTKVTIRSILSQPYNSTFSFTHATSTATFTTIVTGTQATEVFTPITEFNSARDEVQRKVSDWFNPQKYNVYKIAFNVSTGNVLLQVFQPSLGVFTTVHIITQANEQQTPLAFNMNFRLSINTRNILSVTTPSIVYSTFLYGYIDGRLTFTDSPVSAFNTNTSITTTPTNVLTFTNRQVFNGKINTNTSFLYTITASSTSTKNTIIRVIKNGTYTGQQTFNYIDEQNALLLYDTSATTVGSGVVIDTFTVSPNGTTMREYNELNVNLAPNDTLSIEAHVISGSASEVSVVGVFKESH